MGTLGKMKNPNATVSVQKKAGSNGVGPTKSTKATVQKKAGSNGVGHTKSKKLAGATPSKKMKMGGSYKKGGMSGC
jgi:hypothetical protein